MKEKFVIAFDLDGTLTRAGEGAKDQGWQVLAEELAKKGYPSQLSEILLLARQEFGEGKKGDRYDILWHTFRSLKYPGEMSCDLVKEWARRYDDITRKLIVLAGIHPGTVEVLERLTRSGYVLYIVTANPQPAAIATVDQLGLQEYFKDILGFPKRKTENLREILRREQIPPCQLMYFGDTDNDRKSAHEVGCWFRGVFNAENKERWTDPRDHPLGFGRCNMEWEDVSFAVSMWVHNIMHPHDFGEV